MVQRRRDLDRGWAWVVLVFAYLAVIVNSTTLFMNGVLYIALLDRYNEGETKTSLVGALSTGLLCFSAPLGSVINNMFSCRFSFAIGGVLSTTGIALSAFAPSIDWMIVTSGILAGVGYGLCAAGYMCVVGFYFKKWRNIVISVAFLNIGVAMFLASPLALYFIDNFGLTNTYLIIASIQAHMCVLGVICKPSSLEEDVIAQRRAEKTTTLLSKLRTYHDLSLLKNIPYMCFLCSTCTWNFALTVALIHLSNYVAVLGGSDNTITYVMSSFSAANAVGRFAGTVILSKLHHKSIYTHFCLLAISGVFSSLFPLYSNLPGGKYLFTIQLGICTGLPNALMMPISLLIVGVTKLSDAFGLTSVFCGIGMTTSPIIIGYLYSITGSYDSGFYVVGCVLIAGSLFSVGTILGLKKGPFGDESKCIDNTIKQHHSSTDERDLEVEVYI